MKNAKTLLERLGLGSLALAMALGLAACSKKNPTPPDRTDSETKEGTKEEITTGGDGELTPNYSGNTYDYDKFWILMRDQSDYVNEMAVEKLNDNELDQKVYYRNLAAEKQLHVTLQFEKKSEDEVHQRVKESNMTETNAYGLVLNHGMKIFHEAIEGYYLDWNTVSAINPDAPWWSQNIKTAWTTPSGALYAANGDISYLSIGSTNGLFFNKDLVNAAQGTDPYELVAKDEWTFENFFKVVEEVGTTLQSSGGYGYQSEKSRGPMDAMYATGYSTIVINKDGDTASFRIGVDNERAITAIDRFTTFVKGEYAKWETDLGSARNAFKSGTVAYFDDNIKVAATDYRDMNFGILPFPRYDKEASYQSLVGSGTDTFALPANTTDAFRGCMGDVVECLAYNGYTSVVPFYYDVLLKGQAMKDPQSLKSLQIIHDSLCFDLGHYLNPGGIAFIASAAMDGTYPSFSGALEQFKQNGKVAADLADWLTK
jgi:lipoprotein